MERNEVTANIRDQEDQAMLSLTAVDTVFCTCQNDQSGLIGRWEVTVYVDSRWKSACKDGCRWMVVIDGKVDLDSGVADEVGGVIVDADEGRFEDYCRCNSECDDEGRLEGYYRWNRGYADGKEDGEIFIVIKADREIDRSWFPFLYLLEYDSCKESRVSLDMDLVS